MTAFGMPILYTWGLQRSGTTVDSATQIASMISTAGWKDPSAAGLLMGGCTMVFSGMMICTASNKPSFLRMVGSIIDAICAIA